jgi:hypothetical protein
MLVGLQIAQFNVFVHQSDTFSKLTSVPASTSSEGTFITVTRDAQGTPLLPLTTYSFKALALQADVVCDALTEGGLESDEQAITTKAAAIPPPPPPPSVWTWPGCTAWVSATPPSDFGGTQMTGVTIEILLPTGVLFKRFLMDLYQDAVPVRNLLANTNYLVRSSLTTPLGESAFSDATALTSGEASSPGKLTLLDVLEIGSSSLVIKWEEPQDTGGGVISGTYGLRCVA